MEVHWYINVHESSSALACCDRQAWLGERGYERESGNSLGVHRCSIPSIRLSSKGYSDSIYGKQWRGGDGTGVGILLQREWTDV